MLVSPKFGLSETSEKTLEINVLNELAAYVWSCFRLTLTIIAPTQSDEDRLGFDEIMEGLPSGRVLAVQFKRPYEMVRPRDAVRFYLDTRQLNTLASNFSKRQAYLFLTPLPKNSQVVANRLSLLKRTVALDIFDIPNLWKMSQQTRTLRVYTHKTLTSRPCVEIADPRRYEPVGNISNAVEVARMVSQGEAGLEVVHQALSSGRRGEKRLVRVRKLYYLHFGSSGNFPNLDFSDFQV
jgi:hypothetical protein